MSNKTIEVGRQLCSPILKIFEDGEEPYAYKPLNRKILIAVSLMFSMLASVIVWVADKSDLGFLIPVVVFSCVGLTGLIIGFFGNDRAVAKIWGNK